MSTGRYVRIEFNDLHAERVGEHPRARRVSRQRAKSPYYAPTYTYRLRWNDVPYEPGELKAVAYKDGKQIGEATVRTAGAAGVDATDARSHEARRVGRRSVLRAWSKRSTRTACLCPLADNMVQFKIDGPGEIAGVGNGNPHLVRAVPGGPSQAVLRQGDADCPHEGRLAGQDSRDG